MLLPVFFYRRCLFQRHLFASLVMMGGLVMSSLIMLTLNCKTVMASQTAPAAAETKKTAQSWSEMINTLRDNSDQVWLTPVQGDAFLLLFKAHEHSNNHGTLLLLPDNQQHANWPGLFRHLRTKLPKQGWATMAISLPLFDLETNPPSSAPINTSTAANATSSVSSDPALIEYIKNSQLRFERTLQYVKEQSLPGKLVVVALGVSATALLGAIQQGYQPSQLDGLILIDAYQPFPDAKIDIRNEIIKFSAGKPVQDIFQTQHPYGLQMQQRQLYAQQLNVKRYVAEPLPPTFRRVDLRFSEPQLIFIEKRINSWLQSTFIVEKTKHD
jgi:hypothetical protein